MGFDLYAKENNQNNYFRNNCWYWRPIQYLIHYTCHDFLTEKDYNTLNYNDGKTISKTKSKKIAARLQKTLKNKTQLMTYKNKIMNQLGEYYQDCWSEENIKNFITFAKDSNGFQVY